MKQVLRHVYAIFRLRLLFYWHCHIRRRPEHFIPVLHREWEECTGRPYPLTNNHIR